MTVGREVAAVRKTYTVCLRYHNCIPLPRKEPEAPPFFVANMPTKGRVIFMQKKYFSTKKIAAVALLLALHIVVTRFVAIETQIFRISFSFIPTSLCAMLFGPWVGAVFGFVADFLGMLIFPKGPYFPGFGINEALYAFIYGMFLFNKKKNFKHIILCLLLQTLTIDLGLSTLWLHILYQNPVWVILSGRIITALVMFPIKIFGIKFTWELIGAKIPLTK